jgi:NAD(P)-dependent dehydrogenase (short-subunit alcohol dehydrogenase family)
VSRLAGKVAVVTGGASGIGAATVRRFVDEGAGVVIADLLVEQGEALAAELGDATRFARVDVTSEPDLRAAVDLAVSELGRLDVMFNNAGIIGAVGSIAKLDLADVDRTLAVIVRGTIIGMKCAAAVMIEQGSGVILSTSSPAGVVGGVGPHVYSAAKAAVLGLTRSVAAELRPHRVRVNAIVPGATVTAMTAEILTGDAADIDGAERGLTANAILDRPAQPSDIAAGAVYLASDEAWFVTGQVLTIDGGLTTISGPSPMAIGEFAEPRALLGPAGQPGAATTARDASSASTRASS